jgi:hypothetical protein
MLKKLFPTLIGAVVTFLEDKTSQQVETIQPAKKYFYNKLVLRLQGGTKSSEAHQISQNRSKSLYPSAGPPLVQI